MILGHQFDFGNFVISNFIKARQGGVNKGQQIRRSVLIFSKICQFAENISEIRIRNDLGVFFC